jgi:hypothetical protein
MSRQYEPWAGRVVSRDERGQFATSGQDRFVRRISALIGRQRGESDDYKIQHQPPDREYGAPMHDPEAIMPDVLARPELYSHYERVINQESHAAIQKAARGGPDTPIVVYRAAPKDAGGIHPTNWVTPSRAYALMHKGDERGWKIFKRTVRAGDLFTEGEITEWGWVPEAPGFEARTVRRSR